MFACKCASRRVRLMVALVVAAMASCLACLALAGCAGADDAGRFVGTWDLQYGESPDNGESLSEDNVRSMRQLGLEAYLNLDENGSLALVTFDAAKYGSWKATGDTSANATVEGQSAKIILDADELRLIQADTRLVFTKGDPKASDEASGSSPVAEVSAAGSRSSAGLSDEVVKGALLDEPVTLVDGKMCTIVLDGTGVDRLGDPGYNLQITNHHDTPIDVWVLDPFTVDGESVRVYLFQSVDPGRSETAFMQFDTADLKSSSPASLVNVAGTILVDDDTNTTIAEYKLSL